MNKYWLHCYLKYNKYMIMKDMSILFLPFGYLHELRNKFATDSNGENSHNSTLLTLIHIAYFSISMFAFSSYCIPPITIF